MHYPTRKEVTAELRAVLRLLDDSVRLALAMNMHHGRVLVALRQVRHTAMGVKGVFREGA